MLLVLAGMAVIYLVLCILASCFQESLLFHPEKLAKNHVFTSDKKFEEWNIPTGDGEVNALYFPMDSCLQASKGVILYLHGNAGSLEEWKDVSRTFSQMPYSLCLIDYRGYGKSTGAYSENGFYTDAQAAYDMLKKKFPKAPITVYGRSIGTGIAAHLASKNPVDRLVLESPYYSIADIAKHIFPILPYDIILSYKFPTAAYLKKVNCPVFIVHGSADDVIPLKSCLKIQRELGEKVNLTIVSEGAHNNLSQFEEYHSFLNKALK